MKVLLLLLLIANGISCGAQNNDFKSYYNSAQQAHTDGKHVEFYELIKKAYALNPNSARVHYEYALAASLNNDPEESVKHLKEAILVNTDFDLNNSELKPLEGRLDFNALKKLQAEMKSTIINSDTALIFNDRQLHIESITTGESTGVFYLGSIHKRKIIRVDESGNVLDFTVSGQDGLASVFGLKVDEVKKILWASASPMEEMSGYDSTVKSAVYKYDLKTGESLNTYFPEYPAKEFIFGDLILNSRKEVFVSDTRNNVIFKVNESTEKLDPFFQSDKFWNIQGITFSSDDRYLFIADYRNGVFRLDMLTKELIKLGYDFDLSLKTIDGLVFYNNSLIAIQNYIFPMRVTRYILNSTEDKLIRYEILDRNHPAFNEPTNGCLAGDEYYYVASSQWSGYDKNKSIKPPTELNDIVILKIKLKSK